MIALCLILALAFCGCTRPERVSESREHDPVAVAKEYLKTNKLEHLYAKEMSIRIQTPAARPEMLIAFPLKEQNALALAKGLTEIGVMFDFAPDGSYTITRYPTEDGQRFLVTLNDEKNRSTGTRFVRNDSEL